MFKDKKLFHYENDPIDPKDLEHDLKLAENLIEKLKKIDPLEERRRRRLHYIDCICITLLCILVFIVFFVGIDCGIYISEHIHNKIVSVGSEIPEE